jgi:hypothetical protein
MAFSDNMTGKQKLIFVLLIFGGFVLVLAALVFVPTETGNLLTVIGDWIKLGFNAVGGGAG